MKSRSRELNIFSMSALDLFASAMGAFILIAFVLFPYFPNTGDAAERVAEVMARLESVQNELQAARGELNACESRNQQVQAALAACEEQQQASVSPDALAACEELNRQLEGQLAACEAQQQGSVPRNALGACESRNRELEADLSSCQAQARKKFLLIIMSWNTGDDIDLHVLDPAGREFYYGNRSFSGSRANLEEDNTRGPGNEIWLHPLAEAGTYQVYYKYFNSATEESVLVRGGVLTPDGQTPLRQIRLRRVGDKVLVATITVDAEGNMRVTHR